MNPINNYQYTPIPSLSTMQQNVADLDMTNLHNAPSIFNVKPISQKIIKAIKDSELYEPELFFGDGNSASLFMDHLNNSKFWDLNNYPYRSTGKKGNTGWGGLNVTQRPVNTYLNLICFYYL